MTAAALPSSIAHRYSASVQRSANGRLLLTMVAANGCGGSTEFDGEDDAPVAIRTLLAQLTAPGPDVRGPAADRRREVTP